MLKKFMLPTAISGLMVGAAIAQSTPPATSSPTTPGVATPANPNVTIPGPNTSTVVNGSQTTAQTGTNLDKTSADSPKLINAQQPNQWLASKFNGTDVIGTDDKKIGDVSDILFDREGKIDAYVISVGGFLGVGSKEVALAPSSFTIVKSENGGYDKLKLSMTTDELKAAANFERYSAPRSTTGLGSPAMNPPRPAGANPPATNR